MKRTFFTLILVNMFALFAGANAYNVTSPDGKIVVYINVEEKITWRAEYNGGNVIDEVSIAVNLNDDTVWGKNPGKHKAETEKIHEVIQPAVPHKDALIETNCNQLTLDFRDKYKLLFRVYNDGVAYRFIHDGRKDVVVEDEKMTLVFPRNTTCYFPKEESMYSHNERFYLNEPVDSIADGEFCSLPVLFETDKGTTVLFTETALHNYPCMFLRANKGASFETQFPKFVEEAKPAKGSAGDRNQIITKEADYIAEMTGDDQFPWRVFIIGDDKTLIESNLTYVLAESCKLEDTSWIQPGKVAWDWYNANNIFGVDFEAGINNATYKYYIDFASENGIEYVILDEGWTKSTTNILECNSEIDVEELIAYGKERNVGIILWVLWKPLDDNRKEILETYAGWGAKGVKVDFMQRSDQYMVKSYEEIAKECARLHLLVDYHGAFKPSGLRRAYPNVINYEGVKGSENNKWSDEITPEHNVTIPFIRMAAGPLDYTPGCMRNASLLNHKISHYRPMSLGTRAHQVAMYVVYEAPLQMLCENPAIYRQEQECVDFMVQVPTTWDETIVLDGKVSDYVAIARRKGDSWYIGAMTDWDPRVLDLDLSFLGDGDYKMEILKDGINAANYAEDYAKEEKTVSASSKVEVKMAPGGGWAAILKK